MKTLFDPGLYQFDRPQPSCWEATACAVELQCKPLSGAHSCDVAIIGGGYTGLSAALHLARDFDIDVALLEDPSVYFGYGYHGNGVNSATWSGRELACWLAQKNASKDLLPMHLPAIMRGRPPRFPLAFLRRQYLRAGIGYYRLRDFFDI